MTTIAWDGKSLAADTLCVNGHVRSGYIAKVAKGRDGDLAGACGRAAYCVAFLGWIEGGRRGEPPVPKDENDDRDLGFVALADGRIEQHEPEGMIFMTAERYAAGSGRGIAHGAMLAGADARRAVEIAIELDCYSGGEITVLTR